MLTIGDSLHIAALWCLVIDATTNSFPTISRFYRCCVPRCSDSALISEWHYLTRELADSTYPHIGCVKPARETQTFHFSLCQFMRWKTSQPRGILEAFHICIFTFNETQTPSMQIRETSVLLHRSVLPLLSVWESMAVFLTRTLKMIKETF